jgi:hypothetical protein
MQESDFFAHLSRYQELASQSPNRALASVSNIERLEPILTDSSQEAKAGTFIGHYFHQDLLVANYIFKQRPQIHFDLGSRVDGFITHLLAFEQQTILADIRSIDYRHPCLQAIEFDISKQLPSHLLCAFSSISSLHAIEHVGLGRYGDDVDPDGHIKAILNLKLMLAPQGILYLSYPTGRSRVEFNSQRVMSVEESLAIFTSVGLVPKQLRLVDDSGHLLPTLFSDGNSWGSGLHLYAGCGIWTLEKAI